MTTKRQRKKKVFISYRSDDDRSKEVRDKLETFFVKWGLECQAVEKKQSLSVPDDIVHEELGKSHYLIQILNKQKEPSNWMKTEWRVANTLIKAKQNMRMRIAFHTAETPIKSIKFKEYNNAHEEGTEWIINIDKDKSSAGKIIQSILIDAGVIKEAHGEIVLPDFCYPPRESADISLESFQDFINNYRSAHEKGLIKIYPDKMRPTEWLSSRLEKMEDGEIVRMIGFTLHRYVHPKSDRGVGDIFERVMLNRKCKAELLIFDRECNAAYDRMKIETPDGYDKNPETALLYKDNKAVQECYLTEQWKDKVFIKKYQTPYMGMVIFNDMILLEIYHLGDDGEEKLDKNICGRVPVLLIRAGTSFYKLFESHFKRVWEIAKDIRQH